MRLRLWVGLTLAGVAGCAASVPPNTATAPPAADSADAAAADVTLDVVKWPQLERVIAAHKGKVVLIDVWAEY